MIRMVLRSLVQVPVVSCSGVQSLVGSPATPRLLRVVQNAGLLRRCVFVVVVPYSLWCLACLSRVESSVLVLMLLLAAVLLLCFFIL